MLSCVLALAALVPRAPVSAAADLLRRAPRAPPLVLQAPVGDEDWRAFRAKLVRESREPLQSGEPLQAEDPSSRVSRGSEESTPDPRDPADPHQTPTFWAHQLAGVERGCVLVTRPNVLFVGRPMLQKSVILILEHGPGGTIGLALNRPTNNTLRSVLDDDSELGCFDVSKTYLADRFRAYGRCVVVIDARVSTAASIT